MGSLVLPPWPALNSTRLALHTRSKFAEYAQVTRMLGNGRLEAFCFDGVNRLCHIRGKLRKRVWIGVGDIILLGLREFQDQKYVSAALREFSWWYLRRCQKCYQAPSLPSPSSFLLFSHLYSYRMRVFFRADIILKYDGDEARSLKTYGELPDTVQINAGTEMLEGEEFGDDNFDFDEDAESGDDNDFDNI